MPEPVIYVVRSWPRLSQTFIVNEILALERRGVELVVLSLVRSGEADRQPEIDRVRAPVRFLEDQLRGPWLRHARLHLALLATTPRRYLRALVLALRHPGLAAGYGECSALRGFVLATWAVAGINHLRSIGRTPVRVHAHFAHDPALVGMLTARLSGLPFSFTAHARDLVQIPTTSLSARAAAATAVVTCCDLNADYIRAAVPGAVRPPVVVIRHGVELERFRPSPRGHRDGPPLMVSVGRLVEKKGYGDLLLALREVVQRGGRFRCEIYGDGPLWPQLAALRDSLGLRQQVSLMGSRDSDQVVAALRAADLFVLTPKVTADGDRDGIPNVLVEAMACGLPVVATDAGGVGELVRHDVNGLLAEPGDAVGLAALLGSLLADRGRAARLGAAARRTAEQLYDIDAAARELEQVLCGHVAVGAGADR